MAQTVSGSSLFSVLDEALQTLGTIGCCSLAAQTDGDRSQDSTLPAAVVSDDEIDEWPKFHRQVRVAHEIDTLDFFNDAAVGSIVLDDIPEFFGNDLRRPHIVCFCVFQVLEPCVAMSLIVSNDTSCL